MNQKILTVLLVVFSFLAAFLSGYLLSGNGLQKEAGAPDNKTGSILDKFENELGVFQNAPEPKPTRLSETEIASFALLRDNSGIAYYEKGTGRLLSVNPETKEEKVLKDAATLKNNAKSTTFSPDGRQYAKFIFSGTDNVYYIVISDIAGVASKKIFSTRLADLKLYWPQENLLAFTISDNLGYSKLYSLNKDGEFKEILKSMKGLEINWSRDGQSLLFSTTEKGGRPELFFFDNDDDKPAVLPVSASASKCAWQIDKKTVFCAVSAASGDGEELYRIGISENTKQQTAALGSNVRIKEMLLSNVGNYLVFINYYDDKLYSIKID